MLVNERKIVGEYLNSLDLGMELRVKDLYFIEIPDPVQDPNGNSTTGMKDRFPQSIEVM